MSNLTCLIKIKATGEVVEAEKNWDYIVLNSSGITKATYFEDEVEVMGQVFPVGSLSVERVSTPNTPDRKYCPNCNQETNHLLVCQNCKKDEVVQELRAIRAKYDKMELESKDASFQNWRYWKGVRNVITDRIEQLTNSRV